jgi:hypothetical protein
MTQDRLTEAEIRDIAREEARQEVAELEVEDSDGLEWSLAQFVDEFDLSRRQALQAMGLVALGYSGGAAVRRLAIGEAEAATTDDLTIPGQLTVNGSVDLSSAGTLTLGSGLDASNVTGTVDLTSAGPMKLGGDLEVRPSTTHPGSDTDPAIEVGNDGAGFFVFNNNGNLGRVHEDGDVSTL